jgi:PAS domain S-box-containing protein
MPDTDLRKLEKELARLRLLKENLKAGYRETFEYAGVGIAHVNPSGAFLEANTRFCEMMGLKSEALSKLRFQDLTFRDDIAVNMAMLQGLLRGEMPGYRLQKRYVRSNGELFWADLTVSAVRDDQGKPVKLIYIVNDITRQKADEERMKFLMGELTHRTKNLIAVIKAVVNQTCATHESSEEVRLLLLHRLTAIAASQDALVVDQGESAQLRDLVDAQLAVFLPRDDPRITVQGPEIALCAAAVRAVGMALHELATNALKYGALSTVDGRVDVRWKVEHDTGVFRMTWTERDGPEVRPPERRGFGRLVAEHMVATSTGGHVNLTFGPQGVEWELEAPLTAVLGLRTSDDALRR